MCVASSGLQVLCRSAARLLKFDAGSLLLPARFLGCRMREGVGRGKMGLGSRAGCGRLARLGWRELRPDGRVWCVVGSEQPFGLSACIFAWGRLACCTASQPAAARVPSERPFCGRAAPPRRVSLFAGPAWSSRAAQLKAEVGSGSAPARCAIRHHGLGWGAGAMRLCAGAPGRAGRQRSPFQALPRVFCWLATAPQVFEACPWPGLPGPAGACRAPGAVLCSYPVARQREPLALHALWLLGRWVPLQLRCAACRAQGAPRAHPCAARARAQDAAHVRCRLQGPGALVVGR